MTVMGIHDQSDPMREAVVSSNAQFQRKSQQQHSTLTVYQTQLLGLREQWRKYGKEGQEAKLTKNCPKTEGGHQQGLVSLELVCPF